MFTLWRAGLMEISFGSMKDEPPRMSKESKVSTSRVSRIKVWPSRVRYILVSPHCLGKIVHLPDGHFGWI